MCQLINLPIYRKHSRGSYDSSTIDDIEGDELDDFLDDEESDEDGDSSKKDRRESKESVNTFISVERKISKRSHKPVDSTPSDFKADDETISNVWMGGRPPRPLGGKLPTGHQIAQEVC